MTRRPCKSCGKNRAAKFFKTPAGTICTTCQAKKRSASTHARRIQQTYGLTAEQYAALLDHQGGACAICKGRRPYRLHVDHCHVTGRVRGLICKRENRLLALVKDDPALLRAMADYLENPPTKALGIEAVAS